MHLFVFTWRHTVFPDVVQGRVMGQVVRGRRKLVFSFFIFGGQSNNGTRFSPRASVSTLSLSFHQRSILIFIQRFILPEEQMSEAWEPSKNECPFGYQVTLGRKLLSL